MFKKEKEYLTYADKIIVLSDNYKNSLIKRYDFLKSETIYSFDNSIDLKKFESFPIKTLPKRDNRTTLFYFGIIGQRRGIFTLLSVFQKAIEKGLKIVFKPKKISKINTIKNETENTISSSNFSTILNTIVMEEKDPYLAQSYELIVNGKEISVDDILFL